MSIANEILQQLGGNKFIAMTGANHLLGLDNGLRMALPKNISKANRLEITLNVMDTYNVRFYRYSSGGVKLKRDKDGKLIDIVEKKEVDKTIGEYGNVYCDMLQDIFTEVTGLNTRL